MRRDGGRGSIKSTFLVKIELRLTDTLEMRPHWTPNSDSFTSPPTPTMKPVITTARHAMVRELTLDPSITTLNMALKTIVSDLRTDGSRRGLFRRVHSNMAPMLLCHASAGVVG